jgi:hypothetical protein
MAVSDTGSIAQCRASRERPDLCRDNGGSSYGKHMSRGCSLKGYEIDRELYNRYSQQVSQATSSRQQLSTQNPHGNQLAHEYKQQAENEEDVTEANAGMLRQSVGLGQSKACEEQSWRRSTATYLAADKLLVKAKWEDQGGH